MSTENASAQAEGQQLPADTNQQNVTGTENQEAQAEKTFTQAQLDEIVQKRVAKAERQMARSNNSTEIAELREQIKALTEAKANPESKSEAKPPKRDDFETYEDYIEARADFRADQKVQKAIEAMKGETKTEKAKSERANADKEFGKLVQTRIEAGRKEFADFDAAITEGIEDGLLDTSSAAYQVLIDSDMAHKLAYHLVKNPSEARRILGMSPAGQAREIGKLEDKLSAKKERGEVMDPINGRSSTANGLRDDMSMEAWVKKRNEDIKKR
jgi:hypothetical protein